MIRRPTEYLIVVASQVTHEARMPRTSSNQRRLGNHKPLSSADLFRPAHDYKLIVSLETNFVKFVHLRTALRSAPGRILPSGLHPSRLLLRAGRGQKATGSKGGSSATTIRPRTTRRNLEHTNPPPGGRTAVQSDLDATCPHSVENPGLTHHFSQGFEPVHSIRYSFFHPARRRRR